MRTILLSLLLCASTLRAGEPMCGTHPENDRRVRALHERTRERIASDGTGSSAARPAKLRDGAFYIENNQDFTAGYRSFDLAGQSLVFTRAGNAAFTMRREALQYVEPAGAPVRDFQSATGPGWHYVAHDLPFAFPLFGSTVTRIYVSAFNAITPTVPVEQKGTELDAIEAAVHRAPVLSPLMITVNKPRSLEYPRVWIDQQPDAVIVTWRSSANAPFGYDLQAKLARDGTVTYSYRSVVAMRWGAPILSPGFDPAQIARVKMTNTHADNPNDVTNQVPEALRPMLDIRSLDVERLGDTDAVAIRLTLAGAVDRTKLADGQILGYEASAGGMIATIEIDRVNTRVISFTGLRYDVDGASANVDGNTVELYGVFGDSGGASVRASTYYQPLGRETDNSLTGMDLTPAANPTVTDLSSVPQNTQLPAPIAEPFVLGSFDPYSVWDVVQDSWGLSNFDYDAVAIYQSFYTDLIFYAGAYATGGNPQVDGIAAFTPRFGSHVPRSPTLLHLNQLTYGYSAAERTASQVMMHELGHRWLYFFSIVENGEAAHILNPVSAHPAAYVHTSSAFPVYGTDESSVMGGAYFTPQPDGSYRAHAANMGYSWTDLYLMGLAAPEEVPPWFYLAGTNLPREYWPAEGAIANGEKRPVQLSQITAFHGMRKPSVALSQREFRVLFVLVTEEGQPATDAEVAKVNEWRALLERNFLIATGGRGRVVTTFVRPGKRRAS
jgi:hypothetical protein